ncbi:hypothetical protein HY498_05055 [Candidatus Woesearchaeota archaeon]|nr:hypothetical protein [Candidatus Woesearchaeota archaeon]
MKQECQRCDKKIEVGTIPSMTCSQCVSEVIDFNRIEAMKDVFEDIEKEAMNEDKGEFNRFAYEIIKQRYLSTDKSNLKS